MTFLYDPEDPDWASSYTSEQLAMIHQIGVDVFASYDSQVQDAMLYCALTGEPYVSEFHTTQVEDPLTVYKDNLVNSMASEELSTKGYEVVGPAINTASTINSFGSDIQSDAVIYRRSPKDLLIAATITTISDGVDTILGFVISVAPPVSALISTIIYYLKQGAKRWIIGY